MSGATGGVQARFQTHHPEAVYVHCYAHELNLVLCHTCKAIKEASDFFDTLEAVHSFFSVSLLNHQKFVRVQTELGLKPNALVQLSNACWSCQIRAVRAMVANFPEVIQCFQSINSPTALGLMTKLRKFSTSYCLIMFQTLLGTTEGFHKYLQGENVDLAQAVYFKDAVHSALREMRTNESAAQLYEKTTAFCLDNDIPEPATEPRRKQKRIDDFVVESVQMWWTSAHRST